MSSPLISSSLCNGRAATVLPSTTTGQHSALVSKIPDSANLARMARVTCPPTRFSLRFVGKRPRRPWPYKPTARVVRTVSPLSPHAPSSGKDNRCPGRRVLGSLQDSLNRISQPPTLALGSRFLSSGNTRNCFSRSTSSTAPVAVKTCPGDLRDDAWVKCA